MNGYTKITLNSGEVVGLKFAYPAIRMFAESIDKIGQFMFLESGTASLSIEGIAKFIECGYKNNCLIKEVEPLFKYEDFYNWAEVAMNDEGRAEEIGKIFECYAETEYAKKLSEEDAKGEKKNLSGQT